MIELDKITSICKEFSFETGIDVSEQGQIIIKDILDAIVIDPHRKWKVTKEELESEVGKFMSELSKNLNNIVKEERVVKIITSFDILHWFSKHIDQLCPFEKDNSEGYKNAW